MIQTNFYVPYWDFNMTDLFLPLIQSTFLNTSILLY